MTEALLIERFNNMVLCEYLSSGRMCSTLCPLLKDQSFKCPIDWKEVQL